MLLCLQRGGYRLIMGIVIIDKAIRMHSKMITTLQVRKADTLKFPPTTTDTPGVRTAAAMETEMNMK
jgi:hypothetical protein